MRKANDDEEWLLTMVMKRQISILVDRTSSFFSDSHDVKNFCRHRDRQWTHACDILFMN